MLEWDHSRPKPGLKPKQLHGPTCKEHAGFNHLQWTNTGSPDSGRPGGQCSLSGDSVRVLRWAILTRSQRGDFVQAGKSHPMLDRDHGRPKPKPTLKPKQLCGPTFNGHSGSAAGKHSQRRPNRHADTPPTTTRNTNRGLRSIEAITSRQEDRTKKRREARRRCRQQTPKFRGDRKHEQQCLNERRATAQEPQARGSKLTYGTEIWIATLNMRGSMKSGKREEIEIWMKERQIAVLAIQETHVGTNSKETHKEHTWYFSGEVRSREGYTAGVGFVIENRFLQYVEDVEPVNDKLCLLRLRHAAPITLIATCIPQAMKPEEEKIQMYKLITKQMEKYTHKGPTYTLGDFDARVQTRLSPADEQSIGPRTFDHRSADPLGRSEEVICSRQLFIDFCTENHLKAMNTYFQKQHE